MANGILSIIRGIAGSSDGTTTGTPSVWKVVSGIGSVVETSAVTSLARLTSILAQLDVALSTRATETTAGSIKTAAELIDDAVIAQDGAAGKAMTAGAELRDIAALPADGAAGNARRLLASLKGILYTYDAYLGFGEDASRNVMRVEEQPSYSAETGADAIIVAAATVGRFYGLLYSVTAAAQVILRNDAVVSGSIIKTFDLPVGCNMIPLHGMTYGNGVFLDVVSGTGTYVVLYRND